MISSKIIQPKIVRKMVMASPPQHVNAANYRRQNDNAKKSDKYYYSCFYNGVFVGKHTNSDSNRSDAENTKSY